MRLVRFFACGLVLATALLEGQQRRQELDEDAQRQIREALKGLSSTPPAARPKAATSASPAAAAAQPPRGTPNNTFFVTWRDPNENAFRVGIPQGWRVTGGTVRAAPLDVRMSVRAQSPDGRIQLSLGDPDIGPRMVPDMMMAQAGLREGQSIGGAAGGQILLARYLTGIQFARQYAGWKLCRNPQITGASDLAAPTADMNARLAPMAARYNAAAQASVGEAYFQCGGSVGYVLANTFLAGPRAGYGAHLWFVYQLAAVVTSDPTQAPFAAYVLHTALETLAMNPQWEAANEQQVQQVTDSVTRMQHAMAESIAAYGARQASSASAGGFNHPNDGRLPVDLRRKWASEDRVRQERSDATLGAKWMHSPDGTNVRVDNSATHWWRDYSGNVVAGPESGGPPPGSAGQYQKLSPGWQ